MAWRSQKASFGRQLRAAARYRDRTIKDLAEQIGCNARYLQRVAAGDQDPTWSLVVALAEALEFSTGIFEEVPMATSCPWCKKRTNDLGL